MALASAGLYADAAYCYRRICVVCMPICHGVELEPCKNGWTNQDAIWVMESGGPKEPDGDGDWGPCERTILSGKRYLHDKWLAERGRMRILLQRNPSFGETPDQVHFSCRKLLQSDKIRCTYRYLVFTCVSLRTLWMPLTLPYYGPFSRTTRVSRCQKRTSGLYGAREDYQRQTHWPSGWAPLHPD